MEGMPETPHAQHAAPRSPIHGPALPVGVAVTAVGVLLSLASAPVAAPVESSPLPEPVAVVQVPTVDVGQTTAVDPCAEKTVQDALAAGDDATVIAGFGGGAAFRSAVVAGNAPCISLSDPARLWVVVNKVRPLDPADFAPSGLVGVPLQTTTPSGQVRSDVAAAVGQMADAADDQVGRIGANNGYRSYGLQVTTYASHVHDQGQAEADAGSARPGHSEHQTGLAVDVVACGSACGGLDGFGGTPQSDWVAANAWQYGFIVRYEDGGSPVTGYAPEPWHLRYVGVDLATAYHEGGYHTLEEFFGLPPAPDYTP